MTRVGCWLGLVLSILAGSMIAHMGVDHAVAQTPATPPPTKQPAQVDLDQSFQIPKTDDQGKGHALSHTPALVFTADGKRMVAVTADNEIIVFDAKTRKMLKRHRLSAKATDAVSIDRRGRLAAWVLKGGGIVVVDIQTGKTLVRDDKAGAKWIALSPDGKRLAISRGKILQTRLVKDLSVQNTWDARKAEITNLAWSRDGALLASTASDGTFRVVNSVSGKMVFRAKKSAALYALDFHPTRPEVIFGGHDKKIYQVDLNSGKEQVVSGNQPFWITCLGYSPNGKVIAVGDESCDVWLYDVEKPGKPIFHSKHHVECWLTRAAWAPDNQTFVFGCRPNSHAGKPALFTALNYGEAARSPEVRRSRKALLASIEAELKSAKGEEARAALKRLMQALKSEEKLHGQGGSIGSDQITIGVPGLGGPQIGLPSVGKPMPVPVAPDTKLLPEKLRKLLKIHQETQQKARDKLKKSFNINQWRLQKQ